MIKLGVGADMGSAKVFTKDASLFVSNGFGDGHHEVRIDKASKAKTEGWNFEGHFTVKTKDSVFLSAYDCTEDPIHTFDIGRWFCYSKFGKVLIQLQDMDIHA